MIQRFEMFATAISQIYRSIQRLKSREMAELGLEGPYVMCLFHLRRHPEGLTSSELCALCAEDKAAVSRTVSKLKEIGLVIQESGEGKRRYRAKLSLTQEGMAITETMFRLIEGFVDQVGNGLTAEERDTFYKALGMIAQNLQAISSEEDFG